MSSGQQPAKEPGNGAQHLDDKTLFAVSQMFKALSSPTRIRILNLLCTGEYPVNDIAGMLNLGQSCVSHQLRILKASNLVRFRREGKTVFYSLDDDHVRSVLALGMEHVLEK